MGRKFVSHTQLCGVDLRIIKRKSAWLTYLHIYVEWGPPTLASLRSQLVFCMCRIDPYALARSSYTTVRSFLPLFALRISCVMALVTSTQSEKLGSPSFWTEVALYTFPVRKDVNRLARSCEEYFPLNVEQQNHSELVNRLGIPFLWCKYSFSLFPRIWNISVPPDSFQEPPYPHEKLCAHLVHLVRESIGSGC